MKKFLAFLFLLVLFTGTAHARPIRFVQKYGASNFTPRKLPGLALWLDASDLSTITVATGVSQWNDKSGKGCHATQGTAGSQPASGVNTINGKNVIKFGNNAAQKWMSLSCNLTPNTVFVIFKSHAAAYVDWEGMVVARTAGLSDKVAASPNPVGWTGDLLHNTSICNVGQSTVSAFMDGVQVSAPNFDNFNTGVSTAPNTSTHMFLYTDDYGSAGTYNLVVGADANAAVGNRHYDGDLAEIVITNNPLNTKQNMNLTKYGKRKWAIP